METAVSKQNKLKVVDYIQTVGRRKEAIARVRLSSGTGNLTVNGKPISEYFPGELMKKAYETPFELTKTLGKFDTSIKLISGGRVAQMDALIHGIARALSKKELELRKILKVAGLLTRDPRAKERRKFGLAHKARAKKQSPKR